MSAPSDEVHRVVDRTWRKESGRILAHLTRTVGDISVAEDLAQEATLAALSQWPKSGVPDNPGAWLMTVAKRRAIETVRRRGATERVHEQVIQTTPAHANPIAEPLLDDPIQDDLLRFIFICCHTILPTEMRVALALRMLGGLTTDEIGRAFLSPSTTIGQRIVRAKRAIADAQVPIELPPPHELDARLASVLEVIYLIFNEGYSATTGDDWIRPSLCQEAIRLARMLQELMPHESEVHGLTALLEIQASRLEARLGPEGEPILLHDQDRARWDRSLIAHGLQSLERAQAAGAQAGPYAYQAEIAACHASAARADETDWAMIASLYGQLTQVAPSPIVELNRAVAVGRAHGAAAGLAIVDALANEPKLASYHMLPSVRADLLIRLGRIEEAQRELARAASLANNSRERKMLEDRLRQLDGHVSN